MSDPYLGTRTLMRAFLDAVSPDGAAWHPVPGGDLDHLLDGVGDGLQAVTDFLSGLANIRNPRATPYLDELEREYGISPNPQLTDAQRRAILLDRKYRRNKASTRDSLQAALDAAGFGAGGYGLQVIANDPPVDPGPFTNFAYQCVCGGANAYCGFIPAGGSAVTAVCGVNGGLWVVNGDLFTIVPNYQGCGNDFMLCGYIPGGGGSTTAVCGYFASSTYLPIPVSVPGQSAWPLVFFIAAGVTRQNSFTMNDFAPLSLLMSFAGQGGMGQISGLTMGAIPQALRNTLIEIIMRWKPLHAWAALMVNFN